MADKGTEKTGTDEATSHLINACISGNRESQRELFRRYRQSVYGIIVHNLSADYDIDDILQQVFIKVFKSLENFKGLSSLDTWIYRITSKVCIDQLRKKYRKRQLDMVDSPDRVENTIERKTDFNPEKKMESDELKERLGEALNKLSPEKRLVVSLYELDGFSLQEISEMVNKPVGTVKSRLFHGRKELAEHLEKYMKLISA